MLVAKSWISHLFGPCPTNGLLVARMRNSRFKAKQPVRSRKWLGILATVLLFFVLSSWAVRVRGQEITFAVISDHRNHLPGLDTALEFIHTKDVDFIIVVGDFDPIEPAYASEYSVYGYTVGPEHRADRQEIYFVLGNHDSPPGGEAFFQNNIAPCYPNDGPGSAPEGTVFSFDRGACHFTITNQYWDYSGGYTQEQLDWIEQDLTASSQPYKFVIGHEPAYPRHRHVGESLDTHPAMRDAFWTILVEKGVQAFFCGHTHYSSVVLHNGVYQLDAGRAQEDLICVMIVEVGSSTATVHYYETKGTLPAAGDEIDTIVLEPRSGLPADNADSDGDTAEKIPGRSGGGGG